MSMTLEQRIEFQTMTLTEWFAAHNITKYAIGKRRVVWYTEHGYGVRISMNGNNGDLMIHSGGMDEETLQPAEGDVGCCSLVLSGVDPEYMVNLAYIHATRFTGDAEGLMAAFVHLLITNYPKDFQRVGAQFAALVRDGLAAFPSGAGVTFK